MFLKLPIFSLHLYLLSLLLHYFNVDFITLFSFPFGEDRGVMIHVVNILLCNKMRFFFFFSLLIEDSFSDEDDTKGNKAGHIPCVEKNDKVCLVIYLNV